MAPIHALAFALAVIVSPALFADPPIAAPGLATPASPIRLGLARVLERVRGGTPTQVRDCRWPDARTLAAILPVATDRGSHASGVVVARDRVLTAAHAVGNGGRSFVRLAGGYRAADVLIIDHASDVALLGVDTYGIAPLPIALGEPARDQPVWAVGYPREAGRTTSSGVFRRTREGALHTSAPIDAGQSGGGLLACERGTYRLLGMLRGYGAYRHGSDYVKLADHSVAVAASTIHRVLAGGR